jgi:regulator of replication initiation timing
MKKEIEENLTENIKVQQIEIEELKQQLASITLSQSQKESNSEASNSSKRDNIEEYH